MLFRPDRGFSLVELLTALGIVATLVLAGIPGMLDIVSRNTLNVISRTLFTSLVHARSEAIKTGSRVTVTGRDGNWSEGWQVFSDENNNGEYENHEPLLGEVGALGQRYRLTGNQPVRRYVSYVGTGQTERISGSLQMGKLTVCDTVSGISTALIINSTGRPRIEKGINPDESGDCRTQ